MLEGFPVPDRLHADHLVLDGFGGCTALPVRVLPRLAGGRGVGVFGRLLVPKVRLPIPLAGDLALELSRLLRCDRAAAAVGGDGHERNLARTLSSHVDLNLHTRAVLFPFQ